MAGYDGKSRVHIPTEGSVIKDGYGVRDQAEETVSLLLPNHKIQLHNGSDLRGIATFAMVQIT